MKTHLITITAYVPAPRTREYRIVASGPFIAISRAGRMYRKDIGRKKITSLSVKAETLKGLITKPEL